MSNRFTQFILIAMVLGIVMGTLIFNWMPDSRVELAGDINLIATLFLRLIKMIICLLYTSPSPRDGLLSRMPSSA